MKMRRWRMVAQGVEDERGRMTGKDVLTSFSLDA